MIYLKLSCGSEMITRVPRDHKQIRGGKKKNLHRVSQTKREIPLVECVTKRAHGERATITRSAPLTAISHPQPPPLPPPQLSPSAIKAPEKRINAESKRQKTTSVSRALDAHTLVRPLDTHTHTRRRRRATSQPGDEGIYRRVLRTCGPSALM